MWWPNTPGNPRFPPVVPGNQRMQLPHQAPFVSPEQNRLPWNPAGFSPIPGAPVRSPMRAGEFQGHLHRPSGPSFNPRAVANFPRQHVPPVAPQHSISPAGKFTFQPRHSHPTRMPFWEGSPQSWPRPTFPSGVGPRGPPAYNAAARPSAVAGPDVNRVWPPTPQSHSPLPCPTSALPELRNPYTSHSEAWLSRYGVRPLPDVSGQLEGIISGHKNPIAAPVINGGQRPGFFPSPDPRVSRGLNGTGYPHHMGSFRMQQGAPLHVGSPSHHEPQNWRHKSAQRSPSPSITRKKLNVNREEKQPDTSLERSRYFQYHRKDGNGAAVNPRPRRRCFSPPPPDIRRTIVCRPSEEFYKEPEPEQAQMSSLAGKAELELLYRTFEERALHMAPLDVDAEDTNTAEDHSTNRASPAESLEREDSDVSDTESIPYSERSTASTKSKGSDFNINTFGDSEDEKESSADSSSPDEDSEGMSDSSLDGEEFLHKGPTPEEVHQRKLADPDRLHPELWFNEKGQTNYGPLCRCSAQDRKKGIQHAVYPGEADIPLCDGMANNSHALHHYWVTVTPHANFMTERPTVIESDGKEYTFEGFSLLSHQPLDKVPICSLIRFNIEYTLHLVKEPVPKNFCTGGIDLFARFLFHKVLEVFDWELKDDNNQACQRYHFMPRFIHRRTDETGGGAEHELLCMDKVLSHLINSAQPLIQPHHLDLDKEAWLEHVDSCKNGIVMRPDKKPAAFRIDDMKFVDQNHCSSSSKKSLPVAVHEGIRPVQQSFAGDAKYQATWRSFVKLRRFITNKPVPSRKEQDKLVKLKIELEKMKLKSSMRREVVVELSTRGLIKTGLNSDICQAAMLLPVLVHHVRYHACLHSLDDKLGYAFRDRALLQLALTHPSYHLNFGVNPDQARNSLSNCGVRQPRYGDRKVRHIHTRKRGITQLIRVMSNLGRMEEYQSMIRHNERLEFLGDAVLEFITSAHLYFMLADQPEGGLAMFRSALVQNKNLAKLAKKIDLLNFMQYAHGPDLCMQEDVNHAMANCFEAILGAMHLEAGIKTATDFFARLAFDEKELMDVWLSPPQHPLQAHQPNGDRHLISSSPLLQNLVECEAAIGVEFTHIRLLARAFTHPLVGFNNLTLGTNQRLEFLGDSILQFVVSVFLYKHFPDHHEGHLTLLRSSLVNRRTQSTVCKELGLNQYINSGSMNINAAHPKLLADILEAFVAALYVDKGLDHVEVLCRVFLFPRLEDFIINQDWMDPKSQLQQCVLMLREQGKTPELPIYKVLQNQGPAHQKRYKVGVYFKGDRIGQGEGSSRQQAEMNAAKDALASKYFPELSRQKHFLDRKHKGRRRNFCNRAPRGGRGDHDPDSSDDEGREPRWVEEAGGVSDAGINEEGSGDNDGESAENRAKRLKTDTTVGGGEEAGGFSDAGTNQEGSDENDGESAEN